jgi:hypothetical protein
VTHSAEARLPNNALQQPGAELATHILRRCSAALLWNARLINAITAPAAECVVR